MDGGRRERLPEHEAPRSGESQAEEHPQVGTQYRVLSMVQGLEGLSCAPAIRLLVLKHLKADNGLLRDIVADVEGELWLSKCG